MHSRPTVCKFGSPTPYIFLTVFQLAWVLSAMKPLQFTSDTPFSMMMEFKFSQKSVWVTPSSNCMSQHAMISTYNIGYRIHDMQGWSSPLDVWHDKNYSWILHMNSPTCICLTRSTPLPHKIYLHFEDKLFIFGLSQKSTAIDVVEAWVVFEHHDPIHRIHSFTNKTL